MEKKIAVFGGGSWGTAMAIHLARQGHEIAVWDFDADRAHLIERERINGTFLPGVPLPGTVHFFSELEPLFDAKWQFLAIPTQFIRSFFQKSKEKINPKTPIVSLSKGIEKGSLSRVSQIVAEEFPEKKCVVLSGPTHAEEVARAVPSAIVAASDDLALAKEVSDLLFSNYFRPYPSNDIIGAEMGGALKNIMAIATGMADGLRFGDNTRAAIMTRGLEEIRRIGVKMGGKSETFMGLSGIGDLIVTCTSKHSRNRSVGFALGEGQTLNEILARMQMIAEGVETTVSAHCLCEREKIEAPIIEAVYDILYNNASVRDRLQGLMMRSVKTEQWD